MSSSNLRKEDSLVAAVHHTSKHAIYSPKSSSNYKPAARTQSGINLCLVGMVSGRQLSESGVSSGVVLNNRDRSR